MAACQTPTHPLLVNGRRGERVRWKSLWIEIKTGISPTVTTVSKTIYCPLKPEVCGEGAKTKTKHLSPT